MSSMTRRSALAGMAAVGAVISRAATPAIGDMAPDFTLATTAGGNASLADYRGKKNVVLAFFPKAFTGG